ncbi:MAG: hypothetical protein ACFE88_05485 [Candidatus Hermodarchaeota archaeon]
MFNLEEFEDSFILEKVDRLNKYLNKKKTDKILKLLNEFQNLLDEQEYVVPITYILSILAENRIDLITDELIKKFVIFLQSENVKLKLNSLIVIGFALIARPIIIEKYFHKFAELLTDQSKDVRDNVHYFFLELIKKNPEIVNLSKDILIESLEIEKNNYNLNSLLNFLDYCEDLEFDQLYKLRKISKSLFASFDESQPSEFYNKLINLLRKFLPMLDIPDFNEQNAKNVIKSLDNHFLMKKYNLTALSKNKSLKLKEYLKKFEKSKQKNKKIYFYTKSKEKVIFVYELEKAKLNKFFEGKLKISNEKIRKVFSQVIDNDSELKIFIKTLINLKIINGYYSDIGFFYPHNYVRLKLIEDLEINGTINLKNFNFLPQKFINKIIENISKSTNETFLLYKDKENYASLKQIKEQINSKAVKQSVIELKLYRETLIEEDFIRLIKNLPREYLSGFRKGTQWLTNLGVQKVANEIQNSKIVGYFDIIKISEKLNIGHLLLIDVFDQFVDYRSGIWDKNKEIFYYSKFLKQKIGEITKIIDENEKLTQIIKISKELNIDKSHILSKIDENLQSIAEEIKQKDKIRISEYLEKTGMEVNDFLKFVEEIGISYFKKADLLIFSPQKIEEAKNDIKYMLIDRSKSEDYISLGRYDITSSLIEDLINDLLNDGKLKGIFYENEGEVLFYTERGIRNLILENSFLFSFHDLFYGKSLNNSEIDLIREIFDSLVNKRKLKGNFDEETLTFSSDEVLFAKDYNTVLFELEKMVNKYLQKFEIEFQKIKNILTKKEETIYPQEIKVIQETIDKINEKYIIWRTGLEAFIRKTNNKLLKDQGVSIKKYKNMFSGEKKEEVKALEEDPEVYELLNNFNIWVKRFNKLELKYPNIIFYQKRLVNNPDNKESQIKLDELLVELDLI